jgi:hypothetical protein
MSLRDRIDRLKELLDRSHYGDRGGRISVVTIQGGLPEPMHAYLPKSGGQLGAWDGELLPEFRGRAVEWAGEAGADLVVISGVPSGATDSADSSTCSGIC